MKMIRDAKGRLIGNEFEEGETPKYGKFCGKTVYISKNHYPCIRIKNRKFAIHRIVWSNAYGSIPDGCVVHHKDENILNFQLSNLQMMTNQEHLRHHNKTTRFVYDKHRNITGIICSSCKQLKPGAEFRKSKKSQYRSYCKPCETIMHKRYLHKKFPRDYPQYADI